jgi:hypothetical protein
MPTSGSHFTAQAPLLPVFFLGLLATEPIHKEVSMGWFEQVVQTPVRSVSAKKKEEKKRNANLPFFSNLWQAAGWFCPCPGLLHPTLL